MNYLIQAIWIGLFSAVAYALLVLLDPYRRRVRSRIEQLHHSTNDAVDARAVRSPGSGSSWLMESVQSMTSNGMVNRPELIRRLAKAGIHQPAAVVNFYVMRIAFLLFFASIGLLLGWSGYLRMHAAIVFAVCMGGFGAILPGLLLDRKISRHRILLSRALPDFLDLMTVCLEGGLSLQETIRRVGDELRIAHPALVVELDMVQRDMELGTTLDQALRRFGNRTDYEGIRTLSTFIREAQRFGSNIVDALRSHADMLRAQREQAAEEKAQKAAVKILLPTLLLIFPATFVVAVGPAVIQIKSAFAARK